MCGIVGLHLKDERWYDQLGALLTPMLSCLTDRGPDSAGVAVYAADGEPGRLRYSLRSRDADVDWEQLASGVAEELGAPADVRRRGSAAVLAAAGDPDQVRAVISRLAPRVRVVGFGEALEIVKDVGGAQAVCEEHGIVDAAGYQGLGHTRMATESAVTTEHSHPFAPAADLCVVHNGSFSNYPTVRRKLQRQGVEFDTDNDTEVAARFLAWWLQQDMGLEDALRMVFKELDGFFTMLVATRDGFAVVRDSFACKPAVIAETDAYVAVGSEYRALAHLPGIDDAAVVEPQPQEIYWWQR